MIFILYYDRDRSDPTVFEERIVVGSCPSGPGTLGQVNTSSAFSIYFFSGLLFLFDFFFPFGSVLKSRIVAVCSHCVVLTRVPLNYRRRPFFFDTLALVEFFFQLGNDGWICFRIGMIFLSRNLCESIVRDMNVHFENCISTSF